MRKALLIIGIILSVLATFVLFVVMSFTGNPVSLILSKNTAKQVVEEKYSDMDLTVGKPYYNFKMGDYSTYIYKKGSDDIHFYVYTNGWGKYISDAYESDVLGGYNTYLRIEDEYRNYVKNALDSEGCPYEFEIGYGGFVVDGACDRVQIPYFNVSQLEIDKKYDVAELGKQYGRLVIYVADEDVSVDNAKKVLKEIAEYLDTKDIQYYSVDFVLQHYKNEDGTLNQEAINILDITKEDIFASDYEARFEQAVKATEEYYTAQDNERFEG